jgi:hypothetical protein
MCDSGYYGHGFAGCSRGDLISQRRDKVGKDGDVSLGYRSCNVIEHQMNRSPSSGGTEITSEFNSIPLRTSGKTVIGSELTNVSLVIE